jgi:glycosyltransferase involved in cell wall biosynthesis
MSERPFVLHTRIITGVGGGPEKTILNSPRFLEPHGIDSSCLFLHPPGDEGFSEIEARAKLASAEVISVDDSGPIDLKAVKECVRICRERNVTVWHGHDYKSNAFGLLVRRFHKMKLVTTVHGWVLQTKKTPLYYWVDRMSMKWYDRVICVSQDLFERCQKIGLADEKLSLIENAIVVEDYERTISKTDARAKFGVPADRFLLGACGRLSPEKGFDLLIQAVKNVVADGHDVGLLIAGEGQIEDELKSQIQDAGLADRVQLVGFLSDPRDLYQAIDLFVLSSLREGLPNVVLESMATEVPILTTRVAGIPAVMTHEENGYIVDCDSAEQLEAGLRRCIDDDALRQRIAAGGKSKVVADLSFGARMEKMRAIYESLDDVGSAVRTDDIVKV